MEVIYKISEAELDYKLFEAIKLAFKGKRLRISVSVETPVDLTAYEEKILKNAASKVSYVFEDDQFEEYTTKSLHRELVDKEQFKRVEP